MEDIREFQESPVGQGTREKIAYRLTTTPWSKGGTVTGVLVRIYDGAGTDVSLTKLSGSPTVLLEVIETPLVIELVPDEVYRLEIEFVANGETFVPFGVIVGEI